MDWYGSGDVDNSTVKSRTTLFLFVACLLLGAFILLVERHRDTTAEQRAGARAALRFKPKKVNELFLETPELRIKCIRQGDQWYMREPVAAAADAGMVERLLYRLEMLERDEVITRREQQQRGLSPADYGLEDPRVILRMKGDMPDKTVLIGKPAALGQQVYIRETSSENILSVNAAFLDVLPSAIEEWRNRNLFPPDRFRARKLGVRRRDGYMQLARDESGQWMIQQPMETRADQNAVHRFLDALYNFQISAFISDRDVEPSAYSLDAAPFEVMLWSNGDEAGRTLLMGEVSKDNPDQYYAKWKNEPGVYAVPAGLVKLLDTPLNTLRDRRLLDISADDVHALRLVRNDREIVLQRKPDGSWGMTSPLQRPADETRAVNLLRGWTSAQVEDFFPPSVTSYTGKAGVSPTRLTFVCAGTGGVVHAGRDTNEITVEVYPGTAESRTVNVWTRPDGVNGKVADRVMDTVSLDPLFFRDRNVLDFVPQEIRSITLVCNEITQRVACIENDGAFRPVCPPDGIIQSNVVESTLRVASHLVASSFVMDAPRDLTTFGLAPPRHVLTFGLSGDSGISKAILFGNDSYGGEVYAMVRGQDVVFKLDKNLERLLTRDFCERAAATGETPIDRTTPRNALP